MSTEGRDHQLRVDRAGRVVADALRGDPILAATYRFALAQDGPGHIRAWNAAVLELAELLDTAPTVQEESR